MPIAIRGDMPDWTANPSPLFVPLCLFVALPEPGDDRETLATGDGNDFVKGVGGEGD